MSRTTLPTLTLPLLVPDLFFAALLAAAFVGYRREGAWMQDDHLTLRRQKGFHLHCVCALHPDLCLTVQQSPWAVAAHRANLTLIFPGRLEAEGAQCGPNGACFFTAGRMIKRRRFS